MRSRMTALVLLSVAVSFPGLTMGGGSAPDPEAVAQARRMLKATGVQGGLVVHLGCGDGKLTAALRASESFLVHGLDSDAANVQRARTTIREAGLYGPVSVATFGGKRLPYIDSLVNLLVAEDLGAVPMEEVLRVLVPNGVAYTKQGGTWAKTVNPRPKEMDEWTHFLHGPDNNAVSADTMVGPPQRMQWVCGPRWARSHDHLASISAMVAAGGRIFTIVDEGPTAAVVAPARWLLTARDAFNGIELWRREIPVWEWHLRGFRSGPPHIARRLVAQDGRVYVTLGYGQPVSVLDAATGRTLKTFEGTDGAEEILLHDGRLFVVAGDRDARRAAEEARRRQAAAIRKQRPAYRTKPPARRLTVLDARSGDVVWKKADADTAALMPTTLAASNGSLYFQTPEELVSLAADTGKERWRAARPTALQRPAWSAPTLVVCDGVVLSADRAVARKPGQSGGEVQWMVGNAGGRAPVGDLIAFAADTGKELWRSKCQECYNAPVDVLVADGLVWTGNLVHAKQPGITQGLDLRTGEVKRTRPKDQTFFACGMGHQRCYRNKATAKYLVLGRSGTEFIDVKSGRAIPNHWVRGTCQYGVLPCNGLLYAPSHSCACFIECKLDGFNCLAPGAQRPVKPPAERRVKGPAFAQIGNRKSPIGNPTDWPTYRHDGSRSGVTKAPVPAALTAAWSTDLGAKLSAPVVAGGKVFVASVDRHAVHAVNAADGEPAWSVVAGGRVDSPPTVHDGTVLFGSADGTVTCLRASDGALVWRFLAAPTDRRVVSYGGLESVWPVHGSVLVRDGEVWCAAGRSSYLDGGIVVYRLDAKTGKPLSATTLDSRDPKTGYQRKGATRGTHLPGALPDILSTDGTSVFMRHQRLDAQGKPQAPDVPHLFSPAGFLEGQWWHRNYWLVGTRMGTNYGGWPRAAARHPAGRILVRDGAAVCGFGRDLYIHHGSHIGLDGSSVFHFRGSNPRWTRYRLFALAYDLEAKKPRKQVRWQRPVPFFVRGMVLADQTLFVAGAPNPLAVDGVSEVGTGSEKTERLTRLDSSLRGQTGAALWAVSLADGKKLGELKLDAPPVWDGLAAAGGRLYMSTLDGKVVCLGGKK
ncbi:PQQ-binding-like beta-propeller repeat protein [bacterium]|nr:PQQ-binding-like beta-propeller repeat protein [bacterium]